MYTSEIKVALWGDICYICRDLPLFAELPYLCRCIRVIHSCKDHVGTVKVLRLELPINMCDLVLLHPVPNLAIQSLLGRHNGDFGIGIENVEDTTCSHLGLSQSAKQRRKEQGKN